MESIKQLILSNVIIIAISGIAYILDFITGFSKALANKNVKSTKLRQSVVKGVSYFSFIIMTICLQLIFPVNFELFGKKNVDVFIYIGNLYIIFTEFISIRENGKEFLKAPAIDNFMKKTQESINNTEIKK